jgi:hypothetical protein
VRAEVTALDQVSLIFRLKSFEKGDFENQIPAELAGDTYVPGRLANSATPTRFNYRDDFTCIACPILFKSALSGHQPIHAVHDLRKAEAKTGEHYRKCALPSVVFAIDIFDTDCHRDLATLGKWSCVMIHYTN